MKKILLILLALSMFMVSCGPSKEEAIKKAIEEADANQEEALEIEEGEEPINEEKEDSEEKIDEDAEIEYAVSVDGEDYG